MTRLANTTALCRLVCRGALCGAALLCCYVLLVACGQVRKPPSAQQLGSGFVVRLLGRNILAWRADDGPSWTQDASELSTVWSPRLSDGFFVLEPAGADGRAGDAEATPLVELWPRGSRLFRGGRGSQAGPFGATGLLDLPLALEPQTCWLAPRLDALAAVVHARETVEGVPTSAVARLPQMVMGGHDDCRAALVLDCLEATFAALPLLGQMGPEAGGQHPALVPDSAQSLDACFWRRGLVASARDGRFFAVQQDRLIFQPSRVFSILIYREEWPSLERALASGPPVAAVPLVPGCQSGSSSRGCLVSPLPLQRCVGCGDLVPGSLYSAFLILEPGRLDETVTPVVFRMSR